MAQALVEQLDRQLARLQAAPIYSVRQEADRLAELTRCIIQDHENRIVRLEKREGGNGRT